MLRRSTKIQLALFVIITLLGVSYVSSKYVGLTNGLFGSKECTIHADFTDSGGIFANAEVTYRGVTVGKVTGLHLLPNGVRTDLQIDNCDKPKIPKDTVAAVSNRSVIGEQYVNLIPKNDNGPYLKGGSTLPMSGNTIPVATETLLTNIDQLFRSLQANNGIANLQTTVTELRLALSGRGDDLARLITSSGQLLSAAEQNLGPTIALIQNSGPVLQTQLDLSDPLQTFSKSLNELTAQLKASDGDINSLISNGPSELNVISGFINDNKTDVGVLLANLATTGNLLVRYRNGVEQILELYPALAAGSLTVEHPDGRGYLGFVLNINDPRDCGDIAEGREGYGGTKIRLPSDNTPQAPNTAAKCATSDPDVNVRGSANVPGGDPVYTGGDTRAYPAVVTGDTVSVGTTGTTPVQTGDQSWVTFLTDGLS